MIPKCVHTRRFHRDRDRLPGVLQDEHQRDTRQNRNALRLFQLVDWSGVEA